MGRGMDHLENVGREAFDLREQCIAKKVPRLSPPPPKPVTVYAMMHRNLHGVASPGQYYQRREPESVMVIGYQQAAAWEHPHTVVIADVGQVREVSYGRAVDIPSPCVKPTHRRHQF